MAFKAPGRIWAAVKPEKSVHDQSSAFAQQGPSLLESRTLQSFGSLHSIRVSKRRNASCKSGSVQARDSVVCHADLNAALAVDEDANQLDLNT